MKQLCLAQVFLTTLILLPGCDQAPVEGQKAARPIPVVTVATPTKQTIEDFAIFTGRAVATEQVEVRARVSGQLLKIHFEQGKDVEKDSPLFSIDPSQFQAEYQASMAAVRQAQAAAERAERDFQRAERLKPSGAVSDTEYDAAVSARAETIALVASAEAKMQLADLNLKYANIQAPISGVIGDRLVTEGNIISGGSANSTLLTTILAVDPITVAYDIDEATIQRVQRLIADGKLKLSRSGELIVQAGLAIDEGQFPLQGIVRFYDNQIDQQTGTLRAKAEFPNPRKETGPRMVAPGMFVRVRVPLGQPFEAILVPDSALGSDQGMKYLLTVDADQTAKRLNVEVGTLVGEMRVIRSVQGPGDPTPRPLGTDEKIIVRGLQRVQPGSKVESKLAEPTSPSLSNE